MLALLREHCSNDEIATRLGIAVSTARFHVSEILGKLGVSSREDAARWHPDDDADAATLGRRISLAPLTRLDCAPLTTTARIAAAGTLGLALAGVTLLFWGIMRTSGHTARGGAAGTPAPVAWSVDAADYGVASVMLFDTQASTAQRLHMPSNVGFAEWLEPGKTFWAIDRDGGSYNVYRVDGSKLRALFPQGNSLDHYIERSYDGRHSVVSRSGGVDIIDAATGAIVQPIAHALSGWVSPDGLSLAYITTNPPGALPRDAHTTLLMVADSAPSGATLELPGRTITTRATGANEYQTFDLAYNPWSPDGQYIALSVANNQSNPPIEIVDLAGNIVWSAPPSRSMLYPIWSRPHTLFVVPVDGTTTADAATSGVRVDASTGVATLASLAACCAFSPDGRYAIRVRSSAGSDIKRCMLLDTVTGEELTAFESNAADKVANFCSTISWSADSRYALVSRRGA